MSQPSRLRHVPDTLTHAITTHMSEPIKCVCCVIEKEAGAFRCKSPGHTKLPEVCTACYWEATTSMDMAFLDHYRDVTKQLRGTYGLKNLFHGPFFRSFLCENIKKTV